MNYLRIIEHNFYCYWKNHECVPTAFYAIDTNALFAHFANMLTGMIRCFHSTILLRQHEIKKDREIASIVPIPLCFFASLFGSFFVVENFWFLQKKKRRTTQFVSVCL